MRRMNIIRVGLLLMLLLGLCIAVGVSAQASSADAVWPEAEGSSAAPALFTAGCSQPAFHPDQSLSLIKEASMPPENQPFFTIYSIRSTTLSIPIALLKQAS